MKLAHRRRAAEQSTVQRLLAGAQPASRGSDRAVGESWTGGPRIATRLATVALWTVMATGPLALALFAVATAAAPTPPPAAKPAAEEGHRQAVEEFAIRLVVDWLQATEGEEHVLDTYGLGGATLPAEQPHVAINPAVASSHEAEPDLWSVTVGVTVLPLAVADPEPGTEPAEPRARENGERRYFQVPVEYVGGQLAAHTLPALVPSPVVSPGSQLGYRDRSSAEDPAAATVGGFLSALLAGTGDIDRYLAPGTVIEPVSPQPFTEVELLDVKLDDSRDVGNVPADGDKLDVLATAIGRTSEEHPTTVQYPLVLVARAGRWEIAEIAPVPIRNDPGRLRNGPAGTP